MRSTSDPGRRVLAPLVLALLALLRTGAPAAATSLDDGLIAYYPLDGDAVDASGNGHDGVVMGATPAAGGTAFAFDGGDSIDVPDDPALTLGTAPFTIATWLRLAELPGPDGYYVMGHDEGPGVSNKWILWLLPDGVRFHVNGPSTGALSLDSTSFAPPVDEWHHVAVRRIADQYTFFVDGAVAFTGSDSREIPDPAADLQLGTAEGGNPDRVFRGLLDEVRLYGRGLDDVEVTQLAEVPEPGFAWLLAVGALVLVGAGGTRRS